jgi:hypothetical protein
MKVLSKTALVIALIMPGVASAEIIHAYGFNGDAADSVGGINGVIEGGTALTTDRFGNEGSAYLFSGNGSITMQISSPETVSYSMWASWEGNSNEMLFNSGENSIGPDLYFVRSGTCDAINWNVWDHCDGALSNTPSNAADGNYHHYALVNEFASNTAHLYYDGELLGSAKYRKGGNIFTLANSIAGAYSYGWTGAIDDLTIYDHALDLTEIGAMYSAPMTFNFANAQQSPVPVPEPLMLSFLMLGGMMARRRT